MIPGSYYNLHMYHEDARNQLKGVGKVIANVLKVFPVCENYYKAGFCLLK